MADLTPLSANPFGAGLFALSNVNIVKKLLELPAKLRALVVPDLSRVSVSVAEQLKFLCGLVYLICCLITKFYLLAISQICSLS